MSTDLYRAGTLKRDRRTRERMDTLDDQIIAVLAEDHPQSVRDVEAEAMPAHTLRAMLRDEVEALLPEHALQVAKVAEDSERQHLARMGVMPVRRRSA